MAAEKEKDVKATAEDTTEKEEKTEEKTEEKAEETKGEKKKDSFEETVRSFTEKAAEVVKPAAAKAAETVKKTAAKAKTTAKKTASKARVKAASLMEEVNTKVYIQYAGNEALAKDVLERAKEAYIAEGFKASGIKTVQIYLKPEENAAYYVINNTAGKIDLF